MIKCIGNKYMPRVVHHDAKRVTQAGFKGRAPIASVACHTKPSNAHNTPGDTIPSPHQVIVGIGKVQIPLCIQRNPRWTGKTGTVRLLLPLIPILTAVTYHSSYETSVRINNTNPSIKTIGNKQRAIRRKDQSTWAG